ncbi:hypothetical protein [Streptomyces sp. NPDC048196]|uniref:hypothetical protein n=1 Tax=Streptomyces sp. NPDC048196 TaxID=3154712 RepID=UPI0033F1BFD2
MPAAIWSGRDGHSAKVTADIAQALGAELGLAQPPLAVTLPADSTGVPAGSLLPARERFSGMPAPTHCFVYVDAQAPRPFELRAVVMSGRSGLRRSLGLGPLLHAVPIGPPVHARVALTVTRRGSTPSSFEGDTATASLLNADAELLDLARALSPTTAGPDHLHTWQVPGLLAIEPRPEGALLLIRTLHRAHARTWSLGTRPVLDLAARVESALRQRRTREGGS